MIELVAFDADDTLWHNERLYQESRERFRRWMQSKSSPEETDRKVDEIEQQNMKRYGFGVKGFALSLLEASLELTGNDISGCQVQDILNMAKQMLDAPVELFPHVPEVLQHLQQQVPLMLVTKGDLLHQKIKIERSGLLRYFRRIEIVEHKTPEAYEQILEQTNLGAQQFLMVGNSMRSDILPVLQLGGWAAYIPAPYSWSYEDIDLPVPRQKGFFQLNSISEVPKLIEHLKQAA